jgi:two-component system NtrC family response regulator
MAQGARLTPEDLELSSPSLLYEGRTLKEAREALEKALIQRTLAKNNRNITRTALELGVSRPTLHELLTRHNIER